MYTTTITTYQLSFIILTSYSNSLLLLMLTTFHVFNDVFCFCSSSYFSVAFFQLLANSLLLCYSHKRSLDGIFFFVVFRRKASFYFRSKVKKFFEIKFYQENCLNITNNNNYTKVNYILRNCCKEIWNVYVVGITSSLLHFFFFFF